MIREAIVKGETYAVLHGSVHDRSKARAFEVTDVPFVGHNVFGYFLDVEPGLYAEIVPTRLIRCTWKDWSAGFDRQPQPSTSRTPANLASWLRRIATDPEASLALSAAASAQLSSLTPGGTK